MTITKAITIDCSNTFASVLVVGTNGIVINTANATDKVTIRGLEIQGEGAGLDALRIIKAGQVAIDKVTIQGFTGNGVNVANIANAADVFVTNSYITGVATGINATATAGILQLTVNKTIIANPTTNGVAAGSNLVLINIFNTQISSAGGSGVIASASGAQINIATSQIANNAVGINASNGGAVIRASSNDIYGNGTSWNVVGSIVSDGKNRVAAGRGAGAPAPTIANQ